MFAAHTARWLKVLIAAIAVLAVARLPAQQSTRPKPVVTVPATRPSATAASDKASAAAAAERDKILAGPLWKEVDAEYQQWLAAQVIYTPEQVEQLNAKISAQMHALPPEELREFLDDWKAKLEVLEGADARDAQAWLGVYMTNMADGYRKSFLKKLGLSDIAGLSADELEQEISQIRAYRLSMEQGQRAFERARQQSVRSAQAANAAARADQRRQLALRDDDAPVVPYRTPYAPPRAAGPPPPRMRFYVNGEGRVGYTLPW